MTNQQCYTLAIAIALLYPIALTVEALLGLL